MCWPGLSTLITQRFPGLCAQTLCRLAPIANRQSVTHARAPRPAEQKAMIAKFRDRWEKLKESAKRKKSQKAAAHAEASSVRERIDEEPEAEEAAAEEMSRTGG